MTEQKVRTALHKEISKKCEIGGNNAGKRKIMML